MPRRRPIVKILALVTLAGVACARGLAPGTWRLAPAAEPATGTAAMVVSGSPIASDVGLEVLRRGGNAVDAAVAVGFALAVVHPAAGNIGGGGFMVTRLADGEVAALDYREIAPGAATRGMYLDPAGEVTDQGVTGHLAAGVPGTVAGMIEAHSRFGRLPLQVVMAPAVALARDGFFLDRYRSEGLARAAPRLRGFEASRSQFLVDGEAPPPGTLLVLHDLARTLQAISDSGARVFYEGYIADLIVAEMERGGGLISTADLAAYRPYWRRPIEFEYRGHTIYSMPPSSSGGITIALILNILEGFDPLPDFGTPEHFHLLAEAMRRAFVDRNHYLGDPAFVRIPVDRLIDDAYAAQRRRTIDPERATPSPDVTPGIREGNHTTHYSVVDAEGNAVSVSTTINSGYGSAVTVTGAGFLLNNEMDDFTSAPGKPNMYGLVQGEANAITPHKRMLSAMAPTIVVDPDGNLLMILGTPGGPTIITTVAQVISNVIDHGMSIAAAVAAPRVHHQHQPDSLSYESGGLFAAAIERLESMGHQLREHDGYSGDVAAIYVDGDRLIGVADPRRGGGASGY